MPNTWQSKPVARKAASQKGGSASKAQMLRAIAYWSLRTSGSGHGSAKYKGGKKATLTKQSGWLKKNNAKQLRKYRKERNARYGYTASQRKETPKFNTKSKRRINKENRSRMSSGRAPIRSF